MRIQCPGAALAESLWPELYEDVVALIGAHVEALEDEAERAYWGAVYANLVSDG